jgi:hypothetical protein
VGRRHKSVVLDVATIVTLNQSAVVTLNGAGAGTAQLGPIGQRESWAPAVVSVKTNQAAAAIVNEAECKIYVGPDTSDSNYVDGTLSGSTGDSTANVDVSGRSVTCGEYVFAVWTGGDAGAQGRLIVRGTKQLAAARR